MWLNYLFQRTHKRCPCCDIFITSSSCIESCQNNNFQGSHWWLSSKWQYFYFSERPPLRLRYRYYLWIQNLRCALLASLSSCTLYRFSHKYLQNKPHSLPVRASYGVSFGGPASDWYPAWVRAIIYAISYYTGPSYNGTQPYNAMPLYCDQFCLK